MFSITLIACGGAGAPPPSPPPPRPPTPRPAPPSTPDAEPEESVESILDDALDAPLPSARPELEPTDDDEDGLVGPADLCPRDPEDLDGDRDGDGCPEASIADAITQPPP